jgi:hypothetical protein
MRIPISTTKCESDIRVYDAVVTGIANSGTDSFDEPTVTFYFKIILPTGRRRSVGKRYYGPFRANSALVRDAVKLLNYAGRTVPDQGWINIAELKNVRCKIKVVPGIKSDRQIIVLPPETSKAHQRSERNALPPPVS